ncbi:H-NS family nucleoid-associated regulatory protein [Roseovarius arcticus]|uniref:H-NS histone family protein n=1 Tax=Roseovarius arcticus TaxID=2547404 RepID=UPI001110D3BF|nr:H-NS histone family protein [Roseovarius arcticus]
MAKFDLKSLSVQELKSLQNKVEREMAGRDKRLRKDALSAVKDKAKQLGYSLDDLVGTKKGASTSASTTSKAKPKAKTKTRAPAAPKYRNNQDPSQTWSGRGRPPSWIKDAQNNGVDIETMRIKN